MGTEVLQVDGPFRHTLGLDLKRRRGLKMPPLLKMDLERAKVKLEYTWEGTPFR